MSNDSIDKALERARQELLDLTLRNRLLNTPRHQSRAKALEIVDERGDEVFRLLVRERKTLYFQPATGSEDSVDVAGSELPETESAPVEESPHLPQPEIDEGQELASPRHLDNKLQTKLESDKLQSRLLGLYYDARTIEQEQGVAILYLAIGFLKWFEDESSPKPRYAPLILVPVTLSRTNARSRFRIELADDAICTNLSLQAKLKSQYSLDLPEVDEGDEWTPGDYFSQVTKAISGAPRWEVCPDDLVLGLFSFAKYLLYRDLENTAWPAGRELAAHSLVRGLLGASPFPEQPGFADDGKSLDTLIDPLDLTQVVDADSSQTIAIEDARRGRNLVIQGPPGTGKSQTITNLIASAVQDNKTVLFVAEKMAALEVVKRRLDSVGLGNTCLELHSQKAKKTAVLEQLRTCLELDRPPEVNGQRQTDALRRTQEYLNQYVERLHAPMQEAGATAFELMGEMIGLRGQGQSPPDFAFSGCDRWTAEQTTARAALVQRAATLLEEMGVPHQHPWRGLGLDTILPSDAPRLAAQQVPITAQLAAIATQAKSIADRLELPRPETLGAMRRMISAIETLKKPPAVDPDALGQTCWNARRGEIDTLTERGIQFNQTREQLSKTFTDAAWKSDLSATRRDLDAHGRNWFRWFFSPYRRARKEYQALNRGEVVGGPIDWVKNLDALSTAQQERRWLDAQQELGHEVFGNLWRGADSDWSTLSAVSAWVDRLGQLGADQCRLLPFSAPDKVSAAAAESTALSQAIEVGKQAVTAFTSTLKLDVSEAFAVTTSNPSEEIAWRCPACGTRIKAVVGWRGQQNSCPACGDVHACGLTTLESVSLSDLDERLGQWQSSVDRASQWIAYRVLRDEMRQAGLGPLCDRLDDGRVKAAAAVGQFRFGYDEVLLRKQLVAWPELARFQGRLHEQAVADFCRSDEELLLLARKQVVRRHAERLPQAVKSQGTRRNSPAVRESDPLELIRHELNKKRRHIPVRRLLDQAGDIVQQIKPVFMMSPLSVAQFLAPGQLQFDLLVMDEASQVRPADALGTIARASQIVIVGDDQQLPPTRFFNALLDDASADLADGAESETHDLESILGLCNARGLASRMLKWHYRSRHHSLIAVSNHEFYRNELIVVPSPLPCSSDLGVSFRHVPDGIFDRGGTATNRIEARQVAEAVMEHARQSPERSLGVGCFSVAQRDAILEELEVLRREASDNEGFFAADTAEPFFVKNLENIQGDERDQIFISVGYGRDAGGRLTMNFGPLSATGGERRLNVLITRARRRCQVFSSITAEDIDLDRAGGRGPAVLKRYLGYCQRTARDVPQGHASTEDALTRYLSQRLQDAGANVIAQVGLTGLYIDLGVTDPGTDGQFCLGIELDGPNYHAARWARDRDRLRGKVLQDHGWKLLRTWTPDWYFRPDDELRRVLQAIDAARAEANSAAGSSVAVPK